MNYIHQFINFVKQGEEIRIYPNSRGRNSDNNSINGKENKVKRILTNYDINLLNKRSIEIRSKIQDLANLSSSLLQLDGKLQSYSVVTDEKQESSDGVGGRDIFDYNFTIKNNHNIPKTKIFEINERLVGLNSELSNVNEETVRSLQNLNEKYEKQ